MLSHCKRDISHWLWLHPAGKCSEFSVCSLMISWICSGNVTVSVEDAEKRFLTLKLLEVIFSLQYIGCIKDYVKCEIGHL